MTIVWLLWQNDMVIDVFKEDHRAQALEALVEVVASYPGMWTLNCYGNGEVRAHCTQVARLELERREVK